MKDFLTGYATQLILHLSREDDNYGVAINLLKIEFLNITFIIEEIFKELLRNNPRYDADDVNVKRIFVRN